jgi:hypothetical protein
MTPCDLKALAIANGFKTTMDGTAAIEPSREERRWLIQIPGKMGFVSVHGENTLAVWSKSFQTIKRLAELPGLKLHQRGKQEARFLFGPESLRTVAEIIRARKRRQVTPEQRQELTERLKRGISAHRNAQNESANASRDGGSIETRTPSADAF